MREQKRGLAKTEQSCLEEQHEKGRLQEERRGPPKVKELLPSHGVGRRGAQKDSSKGSSSWLRREESHRDQVHYPTTVSAALLALIQANQLEENQKAEAKRWWKRTTAGSSHPSLHLWRN